MIEELLRRESAQVVASLWRLTGDPDLAEDLLQDACVVALERWPKEGVPDRPAAWLLHVARNRGLDQLRRRRFDAGEPPPEGVMWPNDPEPLADDALRLVFTCCHPALPVEQQVALTLRLVGGLGTPELARAFLLTEPALQQRIVRAKKTLRDERVPFEVPGPREWPGRLQGVIAAIYVIFNEGHLAARGADLQRVDLCREAIRLAGLVAALLPREPEVRGLWALCEIQASRAAARLDQHGDPILLPDQDRSRWDHARIARGRDLLQGCAPGPYVLEARIALAHATAPSFAETDWRAIVALYDQLLAATPSPVVALNRAVAVGFADGPAAGLRDSDALQRALSEYHPFHATRAELLARLGRTSAAAQAFTRAIELCGNERERAHLERRRAALRS